MIRAALAVVALFGHTTVAEARFAGEDAAQLDPEEHYNTETYNDKLSYRYPFTWDELWQAKDFGFRVNAGSLNATRFDYLEDSKFHFNAVWDEGPVRLGFVQERRDDVLEERVERELRVDTRLAELWTIGMLVDGGSHKAYGDVGVATGVWLSRTAQAEIQYWSVDHYYPTKRDEPEDSRPAHAQTVATKGRWGSVDSLVQWRYEYDLPMSWHRVSRGYDYEAYRRTASLRYHRGAYSEVRWFAEWTGEEKVESKTLLGTTDQKSHERRVGTYEVGLQHITAEAKERSLGVFHVERQATLGKGGNSSRSEVALYLTELRPLGGRHSGQWGLHANAVRLRDDVLKRKVETKLQGAWGYAVKKDVRVLLNTTWDVDQLTDDFPYDREGHPFRPWGGGDIQFVAVL